MLNMGKPKEEDFNESESLKQIQDLKYPLIFAPFHGTPVLVKVRELTQILQKAGFLLFQSTPRKRLSLQNIEFRARSHHTGTL